MVTHPTPEELDALHEKYLNAVHTLYDEYKDLFHKDRKRDLRFV